MNTQQIKDILNNLRPIGFLLLPAGVLFALILIILGLATRDAFITPVTPNQNFEQRQGELFDLIVKKDNGDEVKLNVEIADTQSEITKGLMFRDYLPYDQGMLFIFAQEQPRSFWMKNTYIPLDMIFIDEDRQIINIYENATPLDESTDKYTSDAPAKYVLEVNGGFTNDKNISAGDTVFF